MTREDERLEQAKFYNDKGVKDPHVHFLRGSEWADSTMIEKACEWLKEQSCCGYIEDINVNEFIKQFKQAMQEA